MAKDTFFCSNNLIKINQTLINLNEPMVMGILNLTPDSFYDGGKHNSDNSFLTQTEKMLSEGATIIDIGAYSSKPNAQEITEKEELERLLKPLQKIRKEFPNAIISVDTFRSNVAKIAVENGANIINDISAGNLDEKMFETVANLDVPYVLMHMQGSPQTMQQNPNYKNVIEDVAYFFSEKLKELRNLGVKDVILDVGFGFGKKMEHNFELLSNLNHFQIFEIPIMVGLSRKSMIYKTLNIKTNESLNGTTALHTIALQKGAKIIRTHDVKEAVECIKLVSLL